MDWESCSPLVPQMPPQLEQRSSIYCGGFGRDVNQAVLKAQAAVMVSKLGPLSAKATPICQAWASSFHLKFEESSVAKDALELLKIHDFVWTDDAEEEGKKVKKLFAKMDRSVAQRTAGKFHSHYHKLLSDILTRKFIGTEWKLKIVRGQLSVEVSQDLFPMVKLSKDGDRMVADPVLKWVAKVGLTQTDKAL